VLVIKKQGRVCWSLERNYKHNEQEFPLAGNFQRQQKLRIVLSQLNHNCGVLSGLCLIRRCEGKRGFLVFLTHPHQHSEQSVNRWLFLSFPASTETVFIACK
jgi:hypothetical protein